MMDATAWDARYREQNLVWGVEPNRYVAEEFDSTPPGRALDLAAGEGRNAIWLAERGWRVTAVDFSPVAVERARRLADLRDAGVEWVVADLASYQPELGAYQAVIVAYLHLVARTRAGVLARAAAALAPGGTLLVVGHDLSNLVDGVGGPQDPQLLYSPDEIVAELPGLTVRRAERVRRPVAGAGGTRYAIDTLVRAERS